MSELRSRAHFQATKPELEAREVRSSSGELTRDADVAILVEFTLRMSARCHGVAAGSSRREMRQRFRSGPEAEVDAALSVSERRYRTPKLVR